MEQIVRRGLEEIEWEVVLKRRRSHFSHLVALSSFSFFCSPKIILIQVERALAGGVEEINSGAIAEACSASPRSRKWWSKESDRCLEEKQKKNKAGRKVVVTMGGAKKITEACQRRCLQSICSETWHRELGSGGETRMIITREIETEATKSEGARARQKKEHGGARRPGRSGACSFRPHPRARGEDAAGASVHRPLDVDTHVVVTAVMKRMEGSGP